MFLGHGRPLQAWEMKSLNPPRRALPSAELGNWARQTGFILFLPSPYYYFEEEDGNHGALSPESTGLGVCGLPASCGLER